MLKELQEETTGFEEIDVETPLELADERALRLAMIRRQQLERDVETTKRRKGMIVETYDLELAKIQREIDQLERGIEGYVKVKNGGEKIRFPDVGTAYLGRIDAKIEIEDAEAFEAALGAMFVKEPAFDVTAAKAYALQQAVEAGEIIPGTKLVAEEKTLRIRKA